MRKSMCLQIPAMVTIALKDDTYDGEEEALHSINELLQKLRFPLLEHESSEANDFAPDATVAAANDDSESRIGPSGTCASHTPSSPTVASRPNKNPPPILKTRIPRELQAVFLGAQRGEAVHAPKSGVAFRVFERKKFTVAPSSKAAARNSSEKKKSARLWFGSNETVVFDKKLPPSAKLAAPRPRLCRWSSCPSGLTVVGMPPPLPDRSPVTDNRPKLPMRATSPSSNQKPKLCRLPSRCHPADATIAATDNARIEETQRTR